MNFGMELLGLKLAEFKYTIDMNFAGASGTSNLWF
jgi:hypothetical protein